MEETKQHLSEATAEAEKYELQQELSARESELDTLLDKFEHMALEAAQRGEVKRPSERRQELQEKAAREGGPPPADGGSFGAPRRGYGGCGFPQALPGAPCV